MADTPSSILLLRLQSTGSNTNLWGGYLNTALQTLEQAAKGYQSLTVSGSATISWSNYATGNTGSCAFLRLSGPTGDGSLASAATLTLPNSQNFLDVWNASGAAITIMCSGGIGVTIPTGAGAWLYCDGTDYRNAAATMFTAGLTVAGQIHGVAAGTAATDAINLLQLSTAIATAELPATSGTVLNSINDKNAGYLSQKVAAGGLLARATQNSGANEDSLITTTGYVASGANAYAIAPSPTPSAPAAFQTAYLIEFANANTAACTLNDGSGTYALLNDDGGPLLPYDLPAGALRLAVFDGAAFRVKAADIPCNLAMDAAMASVPVF